MEEKRNSRPLHFLGTGSAFNTVLGCNSAWFRCGSELFVIDQGGDVLPKMVAQNLFAGVSRVHVFLTHMHCDHVGGLANMILYVNSRILVHEPDKMRVYSPDPNMDPFLNMQGTGPSNYCLFDDREGVIETSAGALAYSFVQTKHADLFDPFNFSLEFAWRGENPFRIFYSSDAKIWQPRLAEPQKYDAIYHETTQRETSPVHLPYQDLKKAVRNYSAADRAKVVLMHLDNDFDCEQAKLDGFSIAENET